MAIQRLLKRSGEFTAKERRKLDRYFGSEEWFGVLYETEHDLVGEHVSKVDRSGEEWVIVHMAETPGAMRRCYRQLIPPLVYQAITD